MRRRNQDEGIVTVPDMHGRQFAEHIEVIQTGWGDNRDFRLIVDGQEFPWHIDADGISLHIADSEVPGITIRLIANRVTVNNDIRPHEPDA